MDDETKKTNIKSILITLIITIAVVGLGTYAWLTYRSKNTAMVLTIGDINNVQITLKPYQLDMTLDPMLTYSSLDTSGDYVTVSVVNNSTTSQKFSLYYDISQIDSGLQNSNFRYTIVRQSDNNTTEGNFANATTSSNFYILEAATIPANTTYNYKVYTWLYGDGNQSSGLVFKGDLRAEIVSNNCPSATVPLNNSVPNAPVLDPGMIPVTIADNGTVTTVSSSDSSWYDYQNKKWANAVLVKESGVKTREQNKVAGTTINPDDILAYYVWIPRYKYAIPALTCGCILNVNETDYSECYDYSVSASDLEILIQAYIDDGASDREEALEWYDDNILQGKWLGAIEYYNEEYNLNMELLSSLVSDRTINHPRTIDIVFESASTTKSTGTATGTSYYTHPAFTFGTQELSGIWVGKFEMSHNTLSSSTTSNNLGCTTETCTNASGLRILPNVSSLRYNNVSNMYYGTRSMEQSNNVFGITSSDSHMMKNSEWGAVAYLSHSNYGINEEIRINNNSNYMTGCGSNTANGASTTNCEIAYMNASSYPQSTTGNISGIFDMSGGAWEYVMGNYNNTIGSSGFSTLPNAKYYDNYPESIFTGSYNTNMTFCTLATCGGHALNETANWYVDSANFVSSRYPWFHRGGFNNGTNAGAFNSSASGGGSVTYNSWRGVCVAR